MSEVRHTPGPWPMQHTGDGKRIIIGAGLVEGPNGYEVAEVYSDDCPSEVAEANARLIAAAPDLFEALRALLDANEEQANRDGGDLGPIINPAAETARTALAQALGTTDAMGGE